MTLHHIQVFLAVFAEKNITAAAKLLHISQPSVSIIIRDLENFYGVKFFDRSEKKLQITPEGYVFYEHASRIATQFDHMNRALKNIYQEQSLYVSVGISVGRLVMPKLYKKFKSLYPEIEFHVRVFPSENVEQFLFDGSADFAILENTMKGSNLMQIPVEQSPLVVISNLTHPLADKKDVTLQDLANYDLLLREKQSTTRVMIDNALAREGLFLEPVWESHSTLALINAVEDGIGLSILPLIYVQAEANPNIKILDIDLKLTRSVNLCYSKTKNLNTAALKFIDYLKRENLTELICGTEQ